MHETLETLFTEPWEILALEGRRVNSQVRERLEKGPQKPPEALVRATVGLAMAYYGCPFTGP